MFIVSFYQTSPLANTDPDGVTDVRYEAGSIYSQGLEGFSFGKSNNEGYNNPYDYIRGMNIDVLVLGASYMRGLQLFMSDLAPTILGKLSGLTVYNIGASSHGFLSCVCNLKAAAERYKPSKYILMDTVTVKFSDDELRMALNNTLPEIDVVDRGTLRLLLRQNRYLRFLWTRLKEATRNPREEKSDAASNSPELLDAILNRINNAAQSCGAEVIIAYHPPVSLNHDGTLSIDDDPETVSHFSEACAENGIYFLDVGDRFLKEYAEHHIVPYGFFNTSVGTGHMNKYGHRMLAEEIYSLIQRIEAES